MRVEVLYFDGCPHHEALITRLRELMPASGAGAPIELIRIESADAARTARFLGSPTLRIDGSDVEPEAASRTDFGLKCRLYTAADGVAGHVPDELIRTALQAAVQSHPGSA